MRVTNIDYNARTCRRIKQSPIAFEGDFDKNPKQ